MFMPELTRAKLKAEKGEFLSGFSKNYDVNYPEFYKEFYAKERKPKDPLTANKWI